MGKFTRGAKKPDTSTQHEDEKVQNFMAGTSFKLSPVETLRIMATSSIFGEPQYYRRGDALGPIRNIDSVRKHSFFGSFYRRGDTTADVMVRAINDALDHDFNAVMDFTVELRRDFWMRLNPAVIMTLAAGHPKREEFTKDYPGKFADTVGAIALRPDDLMNMVEYFIATNKTKKKLPSVLKRAIAKKLVRYDNYQIAKYQNKGMGIIDLARIVHPRGDVNDSLSTLLKEGHVDMPQGKATWMQLRSDGMDWKNILTNRMNILTHMDIMKQLRAMFTDVNDRGLAKEVMQKLVDGVPRARNFPYEYWVAYDVIRGDNKVNHKQIILDGLEEAIDVSVNNMPQLAGRTMILSDNSGSAWGAFTFKGAHTRIAEINNLSAVATAMAAEEGYVGLFGDGLEEFAISKRNGALTQAARFNEYGERGRVGHATENGIWMFFDQATKGNVHWDNIFIYSDQQAGRGGLYGLDARKYKDYIWDNGRYGGGSHIDVMKLVDAYRKKVNSKVNVFSIQTAGYNNMVIPEHVYRGAILSGWTSKEAMFADALIKEWNQIEESKAKHRAEKKQQRKAGN